MPSKIARSFSQHSICGEEAVSYLKNNPLAFFFSFFSGSDSGISIVFSFGQGSRIVHPYGHILAESPEDGKECAITGEIDMEQLERYRTKFPTLNDILWKKDYC